MRSRLRSALLFALYRWQNRLSFHNILKKQLSIRCFKPKGDLDYEYGSASRPAGSTSLAALQHRSAHDDTRGIAPVQQPL